MARPPLLRHSAAAMAPRTPCAAGRRGAAPGRRAVALNPAVAPREALDRWPPDFGPSICGGRAPPRPAPRAQARVRRPLSAPPANGSSARHCPLRTPSPALPISCFRRCPPRRRRSPAAPPRFARGWARARGERGRGAGCGAPFFDQVPQVHSRRRVHVCVRARTGSSLGARAAPPAIGGLRAPGVGACRPGRQFPPRAQGSTLDPFPRPRPGPPRPPHRGARARQAAQRRPARSSVHLPLLPCTTGAAPAPPPRVLIKAGAPRRARPRRAAPGQDAPRRAATPNAYPRPARVRRAPRGAPSTLK
jgi:hypothetical protein